MWLRGGRGGWGVGERVCVVVVGGGGVGEMRAVTFGGGFGGGRCRWWWGGGVGNAGVVNKKSCGRGWCALCVSCVWRAEGGGGACRGRWVWVVVCLFQAG